MPIRALLPSDALRYRALMLEAYVVAADAFTSTAEERGQEPVSWWAARIGSPDGQRVAFGAEDGGDMVGTVALEYTAKPKSRHAALLIGMYVRESARGAGLGRRLVEAALGHARQQAGIEIVNLTVTEGNGPAIRLYRRAGFQDWGTQPMAIATPSGYKAKVHMSCILAGGSRPPTEE